MPLVLLEDVSNVYGDVEIDRNKHIHKKRKLAEGREKTMVILSDMINRLYVYGLLKMNVKYSFGAKLIQLGSFNYNYYVNQWFLTGGETFGSI